MDDYVSSFGILLSIVGRPLGEIKKANVALSVRPPPSPQT